MMRSMFSAISGLSAHQSKMDVIGNNVANVNTVGFKEGRMTFQDALSQTMTGATRPGTSSQASGGSNGIQVGLGVGVSAVDNVFNQGNLETTGITTDLALEGTAFFAVKNGQKNGYTRSGAFQLDANGRMVMPSNGYVLQGLMADGSGAINAGTNISDVVVPVNSQAPAHATTKVDFARNLDMDSQAKGTVTYGKPWYAAVTNDALLTGMHDNMGNSLGIEPGDVLTISGKGGNGPVKSTFTVNGSTTMEELASQVQSFLSSGLGVGGSVSVEDGKLKVVPNGPVNNLEISSSRPTSNSFVTNAFAFPTAFNAAQSTATLLMPARSDSLMRDVVDMNGKPLGLEPGDVITMQAQVGGVSGAASTLTYGDSTTMGDLLATIQNQLRLPEDDGTTQRKPSVEINQPGGDPNIPVGAIILRGQAGKEFGLSNISITASNANNSAENKPVYFNSNTAFTQTQEARSAKVEDTSITVFDDKGFEHTLKVSFTPSKLENEWLWTASMAGNESLMGGDRGKVTFGPDGTVASFTFDDNSGQFRMDPKNGSSLMTISFDAGGPGNFQGLTQYRAPSTAAASKQDGFTMGVLQAITIGNDGIVTGNFTNGTTRSLAQIMVADFTNPGGLSKQSESVYAVTGNSGDPILGKPGTHSTTQIKSGTLEMSNVDLAKEFTSMIITQRGFQASSKVITTSDSLLQELIGLAR